MPFGENGIGWRGAETGREEAPVGSAGRGEGKVGPGGPMAGENDREEPLERRGLYPVVIIHLLVNYHNLVHLKSICINSTTYCI